MGWLFALVSLFLGYIMARVVLFVVRLQQDLRVLNRMPHPPMGKLGFLDIMRDKDHMAQVIVRGHVSTTCSTLIAARHPCLTGAWS